MTCIGFLVFFSCELAQQATQPAAARYCDISKPIYWSANDTRATKEQADTHNRKWKRLCRTK